MSKEKYLITRLSNRKPISLEKIKTKQKEDGVFFNYDETMISQIIEARENKEFEFVCSQIQNFIEENNIDTCFVMNKDELVDCLQEHQKLKIQITDLQSQLAEKDQAIESLQEINQSLGQTCNNDAKEIERLREQLAEKDKKIEDVEDVSRRLIRTCGKTNCYGKNQKAIAELEKVKWFLVEKIEEKQSCFDSGNYNDFADGVKTICELMLISIENQIKELGGVENVF